MSAKTKNIIGSIISICFLAILTILMSGLFRHFVYGEYGSDFPVHINTVATGDTCYSLMHRLFQLCFKTPQPYVTMYLMMAGISIMTVVAVYVYTAGRVGFSRFNGAIMLVSILLLFVSNLYIPTVFPHLYNHYTTTSQPWHNSTYLLMRFLSVFVLILYFVIYEKMKKGRFSFGYGILFALMLTLCNYAKPSFFLAFAPMALLTFIWLFFQSRGKLFLRLFAWGSCFLASIPIIFYMKSIVYNEHADYAEQTELMISTDELMDFLANSDTPVVVYELSNLLFPLFVLTVFVILKIRKSDIEIDRVVQGFIMFIIAHAEQLLIVETGMRANDGNYSWGVYNCGMLLFLICIAEWLRVRKNGRIHNKYVFALGIVLFVLQTFCGIIYLVNLCRGVCYLY